MSASYSSTVSEFLNANSGAVLAALVSANSAQFSSLESFQVEAWKEQLVILHAALSALRKRFPSAGRWGVLLEFSIPRRERRVDAIILAYDVVCVLEFKTGITDPGRAAIRQVEDYALNLADFHLTSQNRHIVPILVTGSVTDFHVTRTAERVQPLRRAAPDDVGAVLASVFESCANLENAPIDLSSWERGAYSPVPTIIEAATALYAGASVREITQSHSGVENLTRTTDFILRAAQEAKSSGSKVVCFVTGIPGAGKTLAGLNLAHSPMIKGEGDPPPVFVSGNGPLVKILRAALLSDSVKRKRETKQQAEHNVSVFIQNVHRFVSAYLDADASEKAHERVLIFDEAQRAWSAEKNKKEHRGEGTHWQMSEPEMILSIMNRHEGWAVVVALVGGGQEIHEGEAGLAAWGEALRKFPDWHVLASPEALERGQSVAGSVLFSGEFDRARVTREPALHLEVFVRSPKAERLAEWVNRILEGDREKAAEIARKFARFPIVITRHLEKARDWLQINTRGERRCGLVASSGAARLRAFGIETSRGFRERYSYIHWFLAPPEDIRSSFQLEVVATEFEIQGLELDNVGLCWGGDFIWSDQSQSWLASSFVGAKWVRVRGDERQEHARNKYRVLLTRARQGLLIWVPRKDTTDPTLRGAEMDETARYLQRCGCVYID